MKNALKSLTKSGLIALGLTTAASAADAGIYKQPSCFENYKINNFKRRKKDTKIPKFLQENLLVKQSQMEQQKKKVGFLVCYWVH